MCSSDLKWPAATLRSTISNGNMFTLRTSWPVCELGIVSIHETNTVNVFQALDKDYVHTSRQDLEKRIDEYVQAAIDYGIDPKKITAIVDEGDRPAERICNHVIPEFQPDFPT